MVKKKNKKNGFKSKLQSFFNSAQVLIVALIIIIGVLVWFSYHLMSASKTYMFSGKSDYVTILNGVITLNYDINVLAGSDIEYTAEKDKKIVKYKIGYFINKDNTLIELVSKSGEYDGGLSLKGIINEMSAFNITEPYHNDIFFTKDKIKNLENGLVFVIEATTIDGEEILDRTDMNLSKVSR